MIKKKILIATGGTGGHIFPAYSLAKFFSKKKYKVELTTDQRGLKFLKNDLDLNIIKINSSPLIKKNIFKFMISFLIIIISTTNNNLLKENYIRIGLSMSFEGVWFVKQKYN